MEEIRRNDFRSSSRHVNLSPLRLRKFNVFLYLTRSRCRIVLQPRETVHINRQYTRVLRNYQPANCYLVSGKNALCWFLLFPPLVSFVKSNHHLSWCSTTYLRPRFTFEFPPYVWWKHKFNFTLTFYFRFPRSICTIKRTIGAVELTLNTIFSPTAICQATISRVPMEKLTC